MDLVNALDRKNAVTRVTVLGRVTRIDKRIVPDPARIKVHRKQAPDGASIIRISGLRVSSTSEDRDGDDFSEKGLNDMADQFKTGRVPYFLDHGLRPGDFTPSYGALDIIGRWVAAEIEDAVLYATADLDGGDYRAQELARKMEASLPIAHSVGFIMQESDPKTDDEGRQTGWTFNAVDLLECSGVGIPSNPDAVQNALTLLAKSQGMPVKALRDRLGLTKEQEDHDMELTEQEKQQIESQRKAGVNGRPAPEGEKAVTEDAVKTLIKDALAEHAKAVEELVKSALAKAEDDEDDDEEEKDGDDEDEEDKDDEEEDEGKSSKPDAKAAKAAKKRPKPRGMITHGDKPEETGEGKDASPDEAKEVRPFQYAR